MNRPAMGEASQWCFTIVWLIVLLTTGVATAGECELQGQHPAWLFCDDFNDADVSRRYFSVDDAEGSFVWQADAGVKGTGAMVATWQQGQVGAGGLKLLLGANPVGRPTAGQSTEQFTDLYYRHYFYLQAGWRGNPHKLSRLTVLTDLNWSQAMIAHLWGGVGGKLVLDPVSCTGADGWPECEGYNDFKQMKWLGIEQGRTAVHGVEASGQWHCVEAHVALNDAGSANGYQEFWLNDQREALAEGLDFVGDYDTYALNGLFIENWWNGGAPGRRTRVIDNLVVSTRRIGCAIENG